MSRYEESISASESAKVKGRRQVFSLRTSLFGTEESFGLHEGFRSDHRVPTRMVAKSVREARRAFDSGEKSGYQQSVESKVNEFTKHRCCWLGVVAV